MSIGFYSFFRVDLPTIFTIVESHPDNSAFPDLGLLLPWPQLLDYTQELTEKMDLLDDHEYAHLPCIAIIHRFLCHWKKQHGGRGPTSIREREMFRQLIQSSARKSKSGIIHENFEEAISMCRRVLVEQTLPTTLNQVFGQADALTVSGSVFHYLSKLTEALGTCSGVRAGW